MKQIAIIGCGVVGASIAYELSQNPELQITVFDRQPPAQASTGAALGVLMGAISQKVKGRAWAMRQASLRRYATLIPELEAITGRKLPWNQQGILLLRFQPGDLASWQQLVEIRRSQGWQLQLWELDKLRAYCPQVTHPGVVGAVYSPDDRQVDPTALTLALVAAAEHQGVCFRFGEAVCQWSMTEATDRPYRVQTDRDTLAVDWIVITAGLGSAQLTQTNQRPVNLQPVLGQAMQVQLAKPMGNLDFQPVITGEDIHIVPMEQGKYWVGATVEFPAPSGEATANPDRLQEIWQGAVALCPELIQGTIVKSWSGLRPRPSDRPAPVIEPLVDYSQVLIATGHYRNGVLLAPATALAIREAIVGQRSEP